MYRNLKKLRKNKGITLKELAAKTGLGVSTIGNFETGRYEMAQENLKKIADVLEVSILEIERPIFHEEPTHAREPPPSYKAMEKRLTIEDRLERLERGMEAILRILSEDRNPKPEPLPKPGKPLTYPKGSE